MTQCICHMNSCVIVLCGCVLYRLPFCLSLVSFLLVLHGLTQLLYLGKVCDHSSSLMSQVTTLLYFLAALCHSFKLQHSSSLMVLLFRQSVSLSCSYLFFTWDFLCLGSSVTTSTPSPEQLPTFLHTRPWYFTSRYILHLQVLPKLLLQEIRSL